MEGFMVSSVTGAISSLLTKFTTLLEKKYKLRKGVKKEITFLRDEMSSMNALLVDLSRMEELDEQHKEWRDKVRELSYDMEDCIDIFFNYHGGGKARLFKRLMASNRIAKRIIELKARAVEASNRHNRYMVHVSISQPCLVTVDPRMTAFYEDTSSHVGIDRARDKIMLWLKEGGQQVEQLSRPCSEASKKTKVISIVGFGGVGKTTLAKQVYTKVKSQFDCAAFVSASQNPNMVKIFSDIVSGVGCSEPSSLKDVCKIIDLLREHLKDKRYLVVVDDVWTVEAWDIIKNSFVENSHGSRVIITTRIEDVANAWYPSFNGHVYRVEPLNDSDSRILFHRRIFGSEDACPEQLKAVSVEILKKCGGLPLAILTVASILASHKEVNVKESWENIKVYLGFQLERNHAFGRMRHVFNLGYKDLPLDLKTCMLYLGIFPEDYEIVKDDLVKRWIAEGFVTDKSGFGSKEIVAESYFHELINKNIIQISDMDDCGHVHSCRVHDVMLEFIRSKATEENLITVINDLHNTRSSLKVRRLSLQVRDSECSNHALGDMVLTQVRSFNFWGPPECMPSLSKFQLVRVVHLDVYHSQSQDGQCDISSLCKFFQLRYLRIRGLGCSQLPRQLHNLQHLETLEIHPGKMRTMEIDSTKLPPTLWHLLVPSTAKLIGAIERMKALRTLGDLDIHPEDAEKNIKGLCELANLRELKLSWSHSSSQIAHVIGDLLPSSLCGLRDLQSLIIGGSFDIPEDALTRWHTPPRHLRRLHALVCPFSTVPTDWLTQLNSLRSLEIKVVSLPRGGAEVLARLTSLVHLRLHVDEHAPEEGVVIRRAAFPHLKEFSFAYQVPCLTFEAGAMPRLRSLTMQCYASTKRQVDDVLDGIEYLGSLKSFRAYIVDFDLCIAQAQGPNKVDQRWNKQDLEAAFRMAISKHPGGFDIRILHVWI